MSPAAPRRTVVLGTAVAALLLLLAAPTPAESVRTLRDAGSATDQAAPLVALLSLLAWLLAAWLVVTVAVTAGGHLPGVAGRALAAVSRRTAPAALRRGVEVALGLSVAVGVLGASPAAASPGTEAGPAAPTGVHLDWSAPAPGLDRSAPVPPRAPGLDWSAPAPGLEPSGPGSDPSAAPEPPAAPPAQDLDWAARAAVADGPDSVVVQPGDSLWALAEQDLAGRGEATTDADVAQAWPTWWAANRDAVGDDPDLLQPGTRLSPPTDGSTPPASS